jgi:hypothetical protein
MTPREKADRAKQLLEDPVFRHVFADIREQLIVKLESVAVTDLEAQHEFTITLQLLKQLKTQLTRYTDEIAIDNAQARHESWIQRAKQRITL